VVNGAAIIHSLIFESFGVRVRIDVNSPDAVAPLREVVMEALPGCVRFERSGGAEYHFRLNWNSNGNDSLYENGKMIARTVRRDRVLSMLIPRIRLTVAEFAKGFVFIHAGVVAVNGKALIIPGHSMQGKTSLVVELLKKGAVYYSDEYAVIDESGSVLPFPKALSVRSGPNAYKQIDKPVETFEAATGKERVEPGLVLFTKFRPDAEWSPAELNAGEGVIELIRNTIPIRNEPAFVFSVLKKLAEKAVFLKSDRPDAAATAERLLELAATLLAVKPLPDPALKARQ
jgi:hypothetical protein